MIESSIRLVRPGRLLVGLVLLVTGSAQAGPTASSQEATAWFVRGAVLWSDDTGFVPRGAVILRDGKVAAVGADLSPGPDDEVVEVDGAWLLPGLVEAHAQTGLHGDLIAWDTDEDTRPMTPELHAIDGYYPFAVDVAAARRAGITTIRVTPGGKNLIGGSAAIVKTAGVTRDEFVVRQPAGLKLSLGEEPKRETAGPRTRMAEMAMLRRHFEEAAVSEERRAEAARTGASFTEDPELATTAAVLAGDIPAIVQVYRDQDIRNALRLAEEFGFDVELVYATEGHQMAAELARLAIPTIVTSLKGLWYRLEKETFDSYNAARLLDAGVPLALQHGEGNPYGSGDLLFNAAVLLRHGVDEEAALRAITSSPADVLGLADRVGRLRPGADGDLVVVSGPPFELRSRVLKVFIDGRLAVEEG